jgi:hypothetical protein
MPDIYIFLITAECTPEDVFKYVGDNAVFASGSPFSNVTLGMPYLTFSISFHFASTFA